jgi:thiopeptide-type bacteriocin biosynthesis protein
VTAPEIRPVASAAWISLHLHQAGSIYWGATDATFLAAAGTWSRELCSAGLADLVFAIRYMERGAHVRWRALPREGAARALRDRMREYADAWVAAEPGRRVETVAYEPEEDRYGGSDAMALSERSFSESTTLAARWIEMGAIAAPEARLGLALAALVAGLHSLDGDRRMLSERAERYSKGYLRVVTSEDGVQKDLRDTFDASLDRQRPRLTAIVTALLDAFDAGEVFDEALFAYASRLRALVASLRSLAAAARLHGPGAVAPDFRTEAIIFSHLHMTSNRLGISIVDEAFLGSIVRGTLA